MQIPATTIATVIAASLAKGVAGLITASHLTTAPEPKQDQVLFTVGLGLTLAALGAGYALGGLHKPNSFARGLLWSGGFSGAALAARSLGLVTGGFNPISGAI